MSPVSARQHFKRCISFRFISSNPSVMLVSSLVLWLWTVCIFSLSLSLHVWCWVCYDAWLYLAPCLVWCEGLLYGSHEQQTSCKVNCSFVLSTSAQEPGLLKRLAEKKKKSDRDWCISVTDDENCMCALVKKALGVSAWYRKNILLEFHKHWCFLVFGSR